MVIAALEGLAGVFKVKANLNHDAFTISYDRSRVEEDGIKRVISFLGFKPRVAEPESGTATQKRGSPATIPEPIAGALAKARETERFLLIYFFAEWCAPCKVLEEDVIPDARVQKALESFHYLTVDTDRFPEAGKLYEVGVMPTLLILDGKGVEVERLSGMIEAQTLAEKLLRVADSTAAQDN